MGVPTAQMPTLLSLELFVAPKNSRMPISARISVTLVLNRNLLSRRHRKITQMISRVCLLDIHSLSVLFDKTAHWCSSDSFWLLRPHISIFSKNFTTVNILLLFRIGFTCTYFTVGILHFFGLGVAFIPAQTIFNIDLMLTIDVT